MVGSIQEDGNGNLWIGTNQGLAKLSFAGENEFITRIYTIADGLPDNFFIKNPSFFRDGKLYFGSNRGIASFSQNIEDRKNQNIFLSVTEILLDGKPLEKIPLQQREKISLYTPGFTSQLTIPATYTNFTIRFASLTYNMPKQNQYAYRLQGFDTNWNYIDAGNRSANYSKLNPGSYTFEVRATNENGEWGEIRQIKIIIEPPFWATWWAYMVYTFLFIIIISVILWEARRRLIMRNRLHLQEMETNKIQELNHIKLQFFTNITHELMTPLTIISASVDDLKTRFPQFEELYGTMDSNIRRLIRLLQQILEFRKAESGNLRLRVAHGNIAGFIRLEAENFEPLIRKKQLHFSVLCEKDYMEAYFDRDKLDKILYNLLSNAAKYNKEGGYIHLSVKYSQKKGYVVISVKDNGKGISEKSQKTLFQRFYDGDYRQAHTTGTGIGLSLTRDLVNLHHGSITVKSKANEGTTFFIELPVGREAYSIEEIIEITEETDTGEQITSQPVYETEEDKHEQQTEDTAPCLLLVEDNEELLSAMVRLLSQEYRILEARNGQMALEIIGREEIDLIISDVVMPEMDGLQLAKKIKSDPEICHIPVILLTAKKEEENREEGYLAGAEAYLTKPFRLSTLHARIKNLLKAKQRTANDFKKQFAFEIKGLDYSDMDEKFLRDAIECVNRHLSDIEFDVPQFTSEMATSRSTLHKKLKSLTGLSATGFIRNIRLKTACKIMDENKSIRISDLAYMVGFNDPKYFSVCFKKEFGMQPTEYLEKYTNN